MNGALKKHYMQQFTSFKFSSETLNNNYTTVIFGKHFQVIRIQRLFRRFLARKHARQLILMQELSDDELSLEDLDENLKP